MNKILRKGFEMLLIPLIIGGSVAAKGKSFNDYALTIDQIDGGYKIDFPVACNLKSTKAKNLNTDGGKLGVIVNSYVCPKPKGFKEGDKYVTKFVDYLIISKEVYKLGDYAHFCCERYPYIRMFRLNTGRLLYYFDMDRDNHPDYGLPGDFPKEIIPLPEKKEIDCGEYEVI